MNRKKNSGQILIITSLTVVMILMATVIYIQDTIKKTPIYESESNELFSAFRVGATHTMISALANFTEGGAQSAFTENLSKYKSALLDLSSNSIIYFDYTLNEISPYSGGVYMSWGVGGRGISSCSASFALNYSSNYARYYSEFGVDLTTEINTVGEYYLADEHTKNVTVTFILLNEKMPTLASNFTVNYKTSATFSPGKWITPESQSIRDFGNGTQTVTFLVESQTQSDPLLVSVFIRDSRGISVMANTTCVQV